MRPAYPWPSFEEALMAQGFRAKYERTPWQAFVAWLRCAP